jgi:hypothetical protein
MTRAIVLLVLTLGLAAAPARAAQTRITHLTLANPELAAGDRLDLRADVQLGDGNLSLLTSGIWLGLISQNVFPLSTAMNRTIERVADGKYAVTDLQVNPWAKPWEDDYTIKQFYVVDDSGYMAQLFDVGGDTYVDEHGVETGVPVINFHVRQNPTGDFTRPKLLAVSATQASYRPGDPITFRIQATDDNSGIQEKSSLLVGVTTENTILGGKAATDSLAVTATAGSYVSSGKIWIDKHYAGTRFPIWAFLVTDQALNQGGLVQREPEDEFYSDASTLEPTGVPVVWIDVEP